MFIFDLFPFGIVAGQEENDTLLLFNVKTGNISFDTTNISDLSDKQKEAFSKEALKKTHELSNYIKVISNKDQSFEKRIRATELALKLFYNDEQLVQISSKNDDYISNTTIKQYLNDLRILPYQRVEIEWYDIAYIREFKKGMDGKYYATITIFQRFKGFDGDGNMLYDDVTEKTIEIVVEKRIKRIGDVAVELWDVLLRNIKVVQTT